MIAPAVLWANQKQARVADGPGTREQGTGNRRIGGLTDEYKMADILLWAFFVSSQRDKAIKFS
jgi:hypothetical protein